MSSRLMPFFSTFVLRYHLVIINNDSPLFCWDLSNDDDWFPFLNKKTPIVSGSIQCFCKSFVLTNDAAFLMKTQ